MSSAIAATVISVAGTAYAANRAGAAGRAQARGADAATAESARQFDQTRADLAPYRVTGGGALNRLASLFGLPSTTPEQFQSEQDVQVGDASLPSGTTTEHVGKGWYKVLYDGQWIGTLRPGGPNGRFINETGFDIDGARRDRQQRTATQQTPGAPDLSSFFQSPGYQFRRDEGTRGIERTAAARGGAASGNALRALAEFNSGLASDEFGKYFNQLAGIAGIGQTATNQTGAFGADAASQAGRNALIAGDARASGIVNQANVIGQGVNDLAGLYGFSRRRPGQSSGGFDSYTRGAIDAGGG